MASTPGRALWRWLVPAVCLVAGLMFATSHQASQGSSLRSADTANLADLVRAAERDASSAQQTVTRLQEQVDAATQLAATGDSAVAAAQARVLPLRDPAGLTAMHGPGLTVVLDDAATVPSDQTVDQNQLVVHQSDLQAVVNALWSGGAEAMSIAGQRVIATSAVRCVGNTLLLNGRVFSPPFRVVALGSAGTMADALDRSPGVALFKQAAGYYGLGYTVVSDASLSVPAYDGPLALRHAKATR